MSGELVQIDRVTRRDYWVDIYDEKGVIAADLCFKAKTFDEVSAYMHDTYKKDGLSLWYEVKLIPASSKR